jgi:hypothetical protein
MKVFVRGKKIGKQLKDFIDILLMKWCFFWKWADWFGMRCGFSYGELLSIEISFSFKQNLYSGIFDWFRQVSLIFVELRQDFKIFQKNDFHNLSKKSIQLTIHIQLSSASSFLHISKERTTQKEVCAHMWIK